MILFINVFITNNRLTHHQRDRGFLNNPARIDVYKYMLASLAAIPYWTKAIFHVQLDNEFINQEETLKEYTKELFNTKTSYYTSRIEYQKDWRYHLQEVFEDQDDLVWFLCNDDHIFIDYDLNSINDVISILKSQKDTMASFFFSHYPEALKAVAHQGNKTATNNLFYYDGGNVDSIQLVTKRVLQRWFFDNEDTDRLMPRPDWKTGFVKTDLTRHYVPIKECCRHFEGYPMVNIPVNSCPPLEIPAGFFENNINIVYGNKTKPNSTWTSFNPEALNYKIVDPNGADYKLIIDDIPLFWQDKINNIDNEITTKEMIDARNRAIWQIANSRPNQPEYMLDQDRIMSIFGR